jgi:hypothetical protein
MEIKKLILWLTIIGAVSLIISLIIGTLTFDLAQIPMN